MKWLGNFEFESHDTDFQEVVKISSVVEYMQEAARRHLEVCGPTAKQMKQNGTAFILSRTTIANYTPLYADSKVLVETWACYSHGLSLPRCTKMYHDDKIVAEMSTVWAVVDVNTHRFVRMGETLDKIAENDVLTLDVSPRFKLPADVGLSLVGEHNVGYSLCDTNKHMNNVRYIDMFSDFIPGGLEGSRIINVDIAYLNEAPMNDVLKIYVSKEVDDGKFYFRAVRSDTKVCAEAEFIIDRI